ncbi:hypothetical protein ACS0TY_029577 [Phlomoides rotata]
MEAQQNEQDQGGKSSSFLCRQSSTRWTPTTDQIRILKDLYYNNGVRSPSAEQIQRISAKLRQYGKIEGKNVFYWFQNHKARERQKKRFTADTSNIPMLHKPPPPLWISDHHHHDLSPIYNKFPNINPSAGNFASSSSVGNYGYGSVERSFRECTINPNANSGGQNYAWIGVDPYCSPYPNFRKYGVNKTLEMEEEEEEEAAPEIETLPLFPMHGDIKDDSDYFNGWHGRVDDGFAAGSRASLELTLNSYGYPTS